MSDFYFEIILRNGDGSVFHKAVYNIRNEIKAVLGSPGCPIVIDEHTGILGYTLELHTISMDFK